MEEQDGRGGVALRVAAEGAEGELVEAQRGESFAGAEAEVGDGVGAVLGGPVGAGWGGGGRGHGLRGEGDGAGSQCD